MQNPLLSNRRSFVTYVGIWILVIFFHILLLMITEQVSLANALADGFISNVVYAAIGLGLWFPIFFTRSDNQKILSALINHLSACVVTVAIWISITYFLLYSLFDGQTLYLDFLRKSLPWRAGIGILFYGVIILVYYLMIFNRNIREKLVQEAELKSLVKESELNSLKSQINPHFLFNSLNSISSLTMFQPEKAQEMIIKLSEFLRYSISIKAEKLTSLQDEISNINRYLDIEKIRFGKRLAFDLQGIETCRELKVPGMILQPLVENAIKYGVHESIEETRIEINCSCNSTALIVAIKNAWDPDFAVKKGEGIGLKNIRSRLRIIYSRDDLMQITKDQHHYEVKILFPQQ
jgi:two-component system, LytTR family, sensor kinase